MNLLIFSQDPENCVWCKRYAPVIERLEKDGYEIKEVLLEQKDFAQAKQDYDIVSTPTTLVLNDEGEELTRFGATTYKNALDKIKAVS